MVYNFNKRLDIKNGVIIEERLITTLFMLESLDAKISNDNTDKNDEVKAM